MIMEKKWIRKALSGGMNTDDDIRAVQPEFPPSDYTDSENTRLASVDGYYNSRVNMKGMTEVPNEYLPEGDNYTVGIYEDREGGTIISFVYNSEGNHGVYQLLEDDTWTPLLQGEALNFNRYRKITGIDVIDGLLYWSEGRENPETSEIEGNPPRKINLAKANDLGKQREYEVYFQESDITNPLILSWMCIITVFNPDGDIVGTPIYTYPTGNTVKDFISSLVALINAETDIVVAEGCDCSMSLKIVSTGKFTLQFNLFKSTDGVSFTTSQALAVPDNFYPSPLKEEYMSRVKWAPSLPPKGRFANDRDYNQNFVAKKYFQFATQYVYDDGEYSCISPISKLVFGQSLCGTNTEFAPNNYVDVNFYEERLNTASSLSTIKYVNLYVRYGYLGDWRLVKTMTRCDFNISTSLEKNNSFRFYNDGNYLVQDPTLTTTENWHPLIATSQSFAQNRGQLGGLKEGYDNIECVDTNSEITYEEPCEPQYGTIEVSVFVRNITTGVAWAGKDYQPITGSSDGTQIRFGGLPQSGATEFTQAEAMFQDLFIKGFLVYSAVDPNGTYILTEQTAPAGVDILPGEGNIYDEGGDMAALRTACAAGQVYSTGSNEWPVGRHIVRIAGNLLSVDGQYYESFPGNLWYKTSLPIIRVGTTGGDVTSYGSEAIVNIQAGVTTTIDIEVLDATSIDTATYEHGLYTGYFFDAEGADDIDSLVQAPNPERQLLSTDEAGVGSPLYSCFEDTSVTDHNGYWFVLYETAPNTAGTAQIKIEGANLVDAVGYGETFYDGDLNNLYGIGTLTPVAALAINIFGQDRNQYICYNHSEDYSNYCRTNIDGQVKDPDSTPISGVTVLTHLSNRVALTDGDGNYTSLVYANLDEGPEIRTAILLYKTATNCCVSYNDADFQTVVVTPFTENGNYDINNPYPAPLFIMEILEYDVELSWKHRNNIKWGIVYMDEAGRRSRVNEAEPVFIPFQTDEEGNTGTPVWKWEINHKPPTWATKYQIVKQINPFYNRYLQFVIGDVQYVKLWDYTTTPPTAIITTFEAGDAVEISMSLLPIINFQQENTGSVLSYIPEKGDRMTFMRNQDGDWYADYRDYEISNRGVGTFEDPITIQIPYNATLPEIEPGTLIEVYTPKKVLEVDFYFEIGECYPILNPGTDSAVHGKGYEGQDQTDLLPATGYIYGGDTFVRDRRMFVLDGTTPNYYDYSVEDEYIYDDDINSRQLSIGAPNIADPNYRQYDYIARVRFSDLYNVDGNRLFNGLSTFVQDAYVDCDQLFGCVQRLVRIGEQAEILAIQTHKVQPLYTDKAPLYELNAADPTVGVSDKPLNLGIPFKAPYGTQHPESVIQDGNQVWCYDMYEGVIWYYASNDLNPISSSYNYRKKVFDLSQELLKYPQARVHVNGAINRNHRELWWAFEKVVAVDPIEVDGEDVGQEGEGDVGTPGTRVIPPDLPDFDPVTIVFAQLRDKWETRVTAYAEAMTPLRGKRFFGFKDGKMWEFDVNVLHSNFFGTQYTAKITVPLNALPGMIKDWYALREKSNKVWAAIEIVIPPDERYPNGMKSRITKNNFRNFEGDWWAQFFKDMTDPSFATQLEALQRGRELKGSVMIITFECADTGAAYLNEIDINFTPSQETL